MDVEPILHVIFFRSASGREPVREWLLELGKNERKSIGEDVKLVQYRWPLGMPLVRKLETGLWEIRCRLTGGRNARVLFTVGGAEMVLLHAFVKKSQRTPVQELDLARERRDLWLGR
jgi:phage-related protein